VSAVSQPLSNISRPGSFDFVPGTSKSPEPKPQAAGASPGPDQADANWIAGMGAEAQGVDGAAEETDAAGGAGEDSEGTNWM